VGLVRPRCEGLAPSPGDGAASGDANGRREGPVRARSASSAHGSEPASSPEASQCHLRTPGGRLPSRTGQERSGSKLAPPAPAHFLAPFKGWRSYARLLAPSVAGFTPPIINLAYQQGSKGRVHHVATGHDDHLLGSDRFARRTPEAG